MWDAALTLSAWLLSRPAAEFSGKRVLELGAGPGLPSLVLGMCTSARVVATDVFPLTLDNLVHNVEGLPAEAAARITIEPLDWYDDLATTAERHGGADFVIAADVVYDPELAPPLLRTLGALIGHQPPASEHARPTRTLLAAERRGDAWSMFERALVDHGFFTVHDHSAEARAALRAVGCPFWVANESIERQVLLEVGLAATPAR